DETAGSSLPRDEVLADHLLDLFLKCDGELVVLDAFDLAIAEHGRMHRTTNREGQHGNKDRRRSASAAAGRGLLWLGFRLDHGSLGVETGTISVASKRRIPNLKFPA